MKKIMCPCCGYYTHETEFKAGPLFEICEVCLWQYDEVCHDKPDTMTGANSVTLNQARKNFKRIGVKDERLIGGERMPLDDELPENN